MLDVSRIVTGPLQTNCYVVSAPQDGAVVIDPGDDFERIAAHLDAESLGLLAVIATHAHHDHIGAAAQLTARYGAPFCLHPADAGLLPRLNFFRHAFHLAEPVPIPEIGVALSDATTLSFGGLPIGILHTPGHSHGSVCLEIEGQLFTGDTLLDGKLGRTDHRGGDQEALEHSVTRLLECLPSNTVLWPGHGERVLLKDLAAAAAGLR